MSEWLDDNGTRHWTDDDGREHVDLDASQELRIDFQMSQTRSTKEAAPEFGDTNNLDEEWVEEPYEHWCPGLPYCDTCGRHYMGDDW
ncbi:hypothetical protein SEA_KENNA_30 [Gordonia phage Kenna]|uniref:Uncharacterized protein n=2 Tax=Getalongvirus kenna TaxID=2734201 RepID=A0A3S9UPU0_9CAUD|nr:hypothetical protein HOU97_gp30 [Gordonia phage Kenna]AZS12307.1 hypothetical protein SEA_KENNA_30 [Gordonia phage Kenna]QCG77188.1 hypothetical protein SEA_LUTUM_31 [Gordonia phage Lutum]